MQGQAACHGSTHMHIAHHAHLIMCETKRHLPVSNAMAWSDGDDDDNDDYNEDDLPRNPNTAPSPTLPLNPGWCWPTPLWPQGCIWMNACKHACATPSRTWVSLK